MNLAPAHPPAPSALARSAWGRLGIAILVASVLVGAALRVTDLGTPSFSDDEIYKVNAVNLYREGQWTLTGDDEHPLAMKLLIFVSYAVRDVWNGSVVGADSPWSISVEAATRGPNALVGAFIALLLAYLARELFSRRVGLIAAALWAVEVNVIGYSRIAKEDTLLAFFLLLTLYFVVRAKKCAEAGDEARARRYQLATAFSIGGFAATKYFFHHLFIVPLFYYFSRRAGSAWKIPLKRWAALFGIAVLTAIAINPTAFSPANLSYIKDYIGHKTVFTHGYLFRGQVEMNNIFEGFAGTPWYFYFTYAWVKLALPILAFLLIGLVQAARRFREDGPRLIFIYLAVWLSVHAFLSGAKWGRFIMHYMPPLLLLAALGVDGVGQALARLVASAADEVRKRQVAAALVGVLGLGVVGVSAAAPLQMHPHPRNYLNLLGGAPDNLRYYLPHCDFYDVGLREAIQYVCARAEHNAQLRTDGNMVAEYYVKASCNRPDIKVSTLSKPEDRCEPGRACYEILQVGRTYIESRSLFTGLYAERNPNAVVRVHDVNVAEIYGPPNTVPLAPATMTELAQRFGNVDKSAAGGVVDKARLPAPRAPRPEKSEPKREAVVVGAYRFAGDTVLEILDPASPRPPAAKKLGAAPPASPSKVSR